ncbi:toprim domain-containing protein [Novosphingobium clariflavum]|uniref:Toprim domain-containing protein n=1 Tax=Novosphingobium clariflavum TaxID=2029884 RepID=A0ABV6S2V9_9SPHN|nr:toprim domain-containing protein [Novosphingobium clariflavum]
MSLAAEIMKGLQAQFGFRKTKGRWLQEGKCPDCGRLEAFCASEDPKIVQCGRREKCGWEDSVRNLLPDLFEDWSKRFPPTEENPNAAADAYLSHERGLDMRLLRGSYTQELYRCHKTGATGATVRFKVGDTTWERIIDRPGRFAKKAHFRAGGSWAGHCWVPPRLTVEELAAGADIWITEGIFDAVALCQVDRPAVSAMSVSVWPEHFLAEIRAACEAKKRRDRPRLIFAFDVGNAGVAFTRKFVDQARKEGWEATAAQVRPDGEGSKLDWNDLLLRHVSWKGEGRKAPLSDEMIDEYLWNGEVTLAKTARDKAKLIHEHKALGSFDFRHDNRLWWCKIRYDQENKPHRDVDEIANCAFRLLYRERDDIADETNYFLQIDFPGSQRTVKERFSASACANSGEFKKRLMAFAGMWSGSGEQLDRLMRNQTRLLKVVEPIPFTGYSAAHGAWLLGDIAVRQGRTVKLNSENYFDFGKQAVKLRSAERILDIEYDADKIAFEWVADLWTAYGPKGLIALAFFTMSFFAVQIREKQKSLGFLEITGLPGSGKTTLIEFLWKTTGRSGYEGFDPNKGTVAFLARNLMKVANLPVGLIEGGRDDDKGKGYKQFDYNELLVLYNGRSPRGTGQRSGGFETSEPPFLGSIYLMQNERIDAIPAVLERLMSMDIDKSRWSPATKVAAQRLENWPIEEVSGTIVHVIRNEAAYLKFYFERFAHHDQDMGKRVEGLTNTRPIKCHSQLAAGVEALSYLFPSVRPEWIAETLQVVDAMALDRQNSCGGDHPTVSDFWDKVQYLLEREKLDDHPEGKSVNQHRDRENHIAINLVDFEARCRNAGIAPPNMDQLKKLLRNSKSRKWIATKNVNNPAGRVLSCWVFDQPKKAERII